MTWIWWYRIACIALCLATLPMFMARDGARVGLGAWLSLTASGFLIYAPTRAADAWLGDIAGWCVLLLACVAWFVGRTPLGQLNFFVLQWFGVRLARVRVGHSDGQGGTRMVTVNHCWLRWIWPLTGWWSDYVWIARRPNRYLRRHA